MYVVATAGHVDHGKSTLVRALTGMEPDRWEEERRRGLTIDLGFAWTTLPSGREVAFVDVPGHERFLANMLAGVGPAPVVCFVVAADKGWQEQSSDHRDVIAALGIRHGIVVVTRADRAPDLVPHTVAETRSALAGTPLEDAPVVVVSGTTGIGLDDLRHRLDDVLAAAPAPDPAARVRLWVDRSFTIKGAGTVITGSLTAGALRRGDHLLLVAPDGLRAVGVRGLQSRNAAETAVVAHARVAVNLRDVEAPSVHRGDALVTPDAWVIVDTVDIRRTLGTPFTEAPRQFVAHIGAAAVEARLRPFDDDHARLTLARPLPLQLCDRFVLRNPGSASVLAGALVLDVDVPALSRRGDGARRARALAALAESGDPAAEVRRRGAIRVERLRAFGIAALAQVPDGLVSALDGAWWVDPVTLDRWARTLWAAATSRLRDDPLAPGLAQGAALDLLLRPPSKNLGTPSEIPPLPAAVLLPLVAERAGLEARGGVLVPHGHIVGLGSAESAVAEVERRLRADPFAAPEAEELDELGLGPRELAAAERAGLLLRLADRVVLLPTGPALAMRRLATLDQPFTTSEARQALGTTRRVVIPLLEHLDARGWTRRVDPVHRMAKS
ncbi:MAG: selenocysteine-specific translation elongation factor [Tessaracoccus sp.]|uniref:selenocysteine-specific translation elongation factor n=1 Tax=Tessaracoccus sp. TaxID=1971211 RepID=UPI001EB87FA9|nr:selenocysteine-specific translation elongation factor [Tessaracoccus sp.]MBK7821832.1 selenocysteine-specific translation elongation factor [Tessaracoccus sp.]